MLYVDEVLQSAPRGSNPYEYAAETLKHVLIVTQVTTSIYAAVTWSKLIRTNSSLVNVFNIAATQWTEGSDQQVNEALRQKATTLGALLQQDEELA
ncbi:hypothetical protein FRC07_007551, partial [Ceratobasidium sp. 392]